MRGISSVALVLGVFLLGCDAADPQPPTIRADSAGVANWFHSTAPRRGGTHGGCGACAGSPVGPLRSGLGALPGGGGGGSSRMGGWPSPTWGTTRSASTPSDGRLVWRAGGRRSRGRGSSRSSGGSLVSTRDSWPGSPFPRPAHVFDLEGRWLRSATHLPAGAGPPRPWGPDQWGRWWPHSGPGRRRWWRGSRRWRFGPG